jgi:hypothetical protein
VAVEPARRFRVNGDISDLLAVIKRERNIFTVEEIRILRKEQTGSFDDMTLRSGSRSFRDFELPDLKKIDKAYTNYSIFDIATGVVAEAGLEAYRIVERLAQKHILTGQHHDSIGTFVRGIGGVDREVLPESLNSDSLPARPVVTVIADVPYANKLETMLHHGAYQGFLFHASKVIRKKYGKAIQVKYDYFSSTRLGRGYQGGSLPRIQISNPGDIKGRSDKPGFSRRPKRR